MAADTSGTTATYPVVIGLAGNRGGLRNGATATTSITTGRVTRALAVPTSAVTSAGSRKVVTVVAGGKTSAVPVETGVMGDTWTQITSGLKAGQIVVLANLSDPLPGSATSNSTAATTGRAGFPAGFRPGGFGGGGFGGGGFRPGG